MTTDTDPQRFFDPATIAKISGLDLRAKQVVSGFISGMHKNPFFGQSAEFVQHKEYAPGDDTRHMDWKVWSRTDRFFIKQFEAETNLRATLIVDTSESMLYGRGPMTKYDYAATAAACLGYLITKQQDSAGLLTFGFDVKAVLPARSAQTHADAMVRAIDASKPSQKTDILKALTRAAETTPTRGIVVIFSDLLTERDGIFKGLEMLRHRKHDVMIFHVLDDDEVNFPFGGMTRFEGMEELPNLFCDPKALRDGYIEALNEYLVEVRRGCTRLGVDYAMVKTSDYLNAVLSRFLFQRMNARSSPARR